MNGQWQARVKLQRGYNFYDQYTARLVIVQQRTFSFQ